MTDLSTNTNNSDRDSRYWVPGVPFGSPRITPFFGPAFSPASPDLYLRQDQILVDRGLLMPVVFLEPANDQVKDVPAPAKGRDAVDPFAKEQVKRTIRRCILAINAAEPSPGGNPISDADVRAMEAEWAEGKFGPKSIEIWKRVTKFLGVGTIEALKILDSRAIDIPVGCPVAVPLDKSGRHIGDQLFRAKLYAGEISFEILKGEPVAGAWPSEDQIKTAGQAENWISDAESFRRSMDIRQQALLIDRTVKGLEHPDMPWAKWHPPKELIERDLTKETREERLRKDKALEAWTYSTLDYLEAATKVQRYAKTIAFLNYMSQRKSNNDVDDLFSNLPSVTRLLEKYYYGIPDAAKIFPDEALKEGIFPGKVTRYANGKIDISFDPPPSPEHTVEYAKYVARLQAWLDKYGPGVEQIQKELALVCLSKPGEVPKVSKDRLVMAGEEKHPPAGATYPPGMKDRDGRDIGGQPIPKYNFCRHGVEVTRDGEYYVLKPYTQYYYARWYAYNHYDWTGGMQPVGEKIYHRDQPLRIKGDEYAACFQNQRLQLVRGDMVEKWAKAAETGDDVEKYVDTTIDLAMIATGTYEGRAAILLARAGGVGAKRAAYVTALKAGWHLSIGGTGLTKQLIMNGLDDTFGYGSGAKFDKYRGYVILCDLTYQGFAPQRLRDGVGRLAYGKDGLLCYSNYMSGPRWADASKFGKVLEGTEHVLQGGRVPLIGRVGVLPLADYYLIFDSIKSAQGPLDRLRGRDPFLTEDIDEVRKMVDDAGPFDRRSPFSFKQSPEEIQAHAKKVFDEYSLHLVRSVDDPDVFSIALSQEVSALKAQPGKDQKPCIDRCLNAFANPQSGAEKLVAASALLELIPAQGDPEKQVLGHVNKDGVNVPITRKQVQDCIENRPEILYKKTAEIDALKLDKNHPDRKKHVAKLLEVHTTGNTRAEKLTAAVCLAKLGALDPNSNEVAGAADVRRYLDANSPQALLDKAASVLFLPDDDSPDGKKRKQLLDEAAITFKTTTDPEMKMAAAVVLLSSRKQLSPGEPLGGTKLALEKIDWLSPDAQKQFNEQLLHAPVPAREVVDFLRKQVEQTNSPRVRLLAADCLLRQSHIAEIGVDHLSAQCKTLEEKVIAAPQDEQLKQDLLKHKALLKDATEWARLVRFDYPDMARVCLTVLDDPNAPKEVKASALVGQTGPRLDFIVQYLKYNVEPSIDTIDTSKPEGRALRARLLGSLHGLNSKILEQRLEAFANDPKQDKDVRVLAASVTTASKATRFSINDMPVTPGSQFDIGSGKTAYIKLEGGTGIQPLHANVIADPLGRCFIKAIDDKAEIWVKRTDGDQVKVFRIGKDSYTEMPDGKPIPFEASPYGVQRYFQVKATDQVILGDREKGIVLRFGLERETLLIRTRTEWAKDSPTPGNYSASTIDRWKADLNRPTTEIYNLPANAGGKELLVNKFQAAVALDRLGPAAGLGNEAEIRAVLNKAFLDCFDYGPPELQRQVIEYLTPERIKEFTKEEKDRLRRAVEVRFRVSSAAINNALPGDPERNTHGALLLACCAKLPAIYEGGTPQERAQIVTCLDDLLVQKPSSTTSYPASYAPLRLAAIDAIIKLSPDRARVVLEHVVRKDKDAEVRLKALDKLQEIGCPNLQQLCIDLLSSEEDPLILKRLRTIEYFERRPDRASPDYQRELRNATEVLTNRYKYDLSGSEEYQRSMQPVQDAAGARRVYNDKYVKGLVYEILTNGRRQGVGPQGGRDNAVENATRHLLDVCSQLPADEAKKMTWAIVTCLLHQNAMGPWDRKSLVTALDELYKKNAISKEDYLLVLIAVLQNEMQRTPKSKEAKGAGGADELQREIIRLIFLCKPTKVPPVIEAIADSKDYPLEVTRAAAQQFVMDVGESTSFMRQTVKADAKASEADLAKILQEALRKPNLDADTLCIAMCSSLNGRPLTGPNDPRRELLYAASRDSHPRVRLLAGIFLFQSEYPSDREYGAQIIAATSLRPANGDPRGFQFINTDGYAIDARQLIKDVYDNPTKYKAGDKALLDKAIETEKAKVAAAPPPAELPKRADAERTLDHQWEYEKALTDLRRRWLVDAKDLADPGPRPAQYKLLGPALPNEIGRIQREFAKDKRKQKEEIDATVECMWAQFDNLIKEAVEKGGELERKFLKYVILTNGSPFPQEYQAEALKRAADGIFRICSEHKPGCTDFEGLIVSSLIESPTLPPYVRSKLLDAYLELVQPKGNISKEDAAITLGAVLKTEIKFMPPMFHDGYRESKERQLLILEKLGAWGDRRVSPVLEAMMRSHPDFTVQDAAKRIVQQFALEDVKDLISGRRQMGTMQFLKDDPKVEALLHYIWTGMGTAQDRLKAVKLVLAHGTDDVKASLHSKLVNCLSFLLWNSDEPTTLESARILLSIASDYDAKWAIDALVKLALTGKGESVVEARVTVNGLTGTRKTMAIEALHKLVEPRFSKATPEVRAKAAEWLNTLSDEKTPKLYRQDMIEALFDLTITGDEKVRSEAMTQLKDISPAEYAYLAQFAIKWCEQHPNADKKLISEALLLADTFYIRSGNHSGSPMTLIRLFETSTKLLGADHPTTALFVKQLTPGHEDCQIKPLKNPGDHDLTNLRRMAESSKDERIKFAAAYALAQKGNEGVRPGDGFIGMLGLAQLGLFGSDEKIRNLAKEKMLGCVTKENLPGAESVIRVEVDRLKKDEKANRDQLVALLTLWIDLYDKAEIPPASGFYIQLRRERNRIEKGLEPPEVVRWKRYEAADKNKDWRVSLPFTPLQELEDQRDKATRLYGLDSLEVARINLRIAKCWIHHGIWGADSDSKAASLVSAGRLCEWAITVLEKKLGPDSLEVADAVYRLATVKLVQGKSKEAIPLLKRSLAIYEKTNSKEHIADRAWIMSALAYASAETGDKITAQDMQQKLVLLSKEDLPKEILTEVKDAMIRLAQHYVGNYNSKIQDFKAAESLFKEALRLEEKLSGENSPAVAWVLCLVAGAKIKDGRPADAMVDYKRSLQIYDDTRDFHYDPNKAWLLAAMSLASFQAGDRLGAKQYAEKVVELANKPHPKEMTVELLGVLYTLGHAYRDVKTFDPALSELLFKAALDLEKSVSGEKSIMVAGALNNLAMVQCGQQKYAEAAANWKQAMEIYEANGNKVPVSTKAQTLHYLATASHRAGDKKTAMEAATSLIKLANSDLPNKELAEVRDHMFSLASLFVDDPNKTVQDSATAEMLFKEVLRIEEKFFGKESFPVAYALRQLAFAESEQGKYKEAAAHLKTAIQIYDAKNDKSQVVGKSRALLRLSIISYKSGDKQAAKDYCNKLLELTAGDYSVGSLLELQESTRELGRYYAGLIGNDVHDYELAELLLKDSLRVQIKLGIGGMPRHADTAADLAFVYQKQAEQNPNNMIAQAKLKEALLLLEKARKVYENPSSPNDSRLADIWEQSGTVYKLLGEKEKAEAAFANAKKLRMKKDKPDPMPLPKAG